jgi:hypothetical protein
MVLGWAIVFAIFPAVKLEKYWRNNTYSRFLQKSHWTISYNIFYASVEDTLQNRVDFTIWIQYNPLKIVKWCHFKDFKWPHLVIFKGWFHNVPPHLQHRDINSYKKLQQYSNRFLWTSKTNSRDADKFYLFSVAFQFSNFEKHIGARRMDKQESRVQPVNQ